MQKNNTGAVVLVILLVKFIVYDKVLNKLIGTNKEENNEEFKGLSLIILVLHL